MEMGAGRGVFGLAVAGVAAANQIPTRLIMVERTGSRSKADKILRAQPSKSNEDVPEKPGSYLKLDTVQWSRIECDLAHMDLAVALNNDDFGKDDDTKVVVIAKHLCGAATDLALKAMEPIRDRVTLCLLATCCHGRCDWNDYVGRDYLQKVMTCSGIHFGSKEFDLLRQWCAGAVACQTSTTSEKGGTANGATIAESQAEQEEPEHATEFPADKSSDVASRVNISAVVNSLQLECGIEGLGRACQRLIDFGRREYLRNTIFSSTDCGSNLVHYVPPHVSPQNACLVARVLPKRRSEPSSQQE
jgi:tRNA:m4X modification enzyme